MRICIYGSASEKIDPLFIKQVENLGEELARRRHSLVFGGGANGLMGAAARGVHTAGGEILGVIPEFFKEEIVEVIYTECDRLIYTKTMRERKQLMEDNADAFIIVPGGIGTFEEFFEILTLKQLCRHSKPIAIYNLNGYYNELEAMMKASVDKGFIRKLCSELYKVTDNEAELFEYIENNKSKVSSLKELKDG